MGGGYPPGLAAGQTKGLGSGIRGEFKDFAIHRNSCYTGQRGAWLVVRKRGKGSGGGVSKGFGSAGPTNGANFANSPPGPHLRSSRFSRPPRLRGSHQEVFEKNRGLCVFVVWLAAPQALGPGSKAPGDLAPGA